MRAVDAGDGIAHPAPEPAVELGERGGDALAAGAGEIEIAGMSRASGLGTRGEHAELEFYAGPGGLCGLERLAYLI